MKVADRTAVVTANAETKVVKPPGIQEAIDAETGRQPTTPSFLRGAYCICIFVSCKLYIDFWSIPLNWLLLQRDTQLMINNVLCCISWCRRNCLN